jgi:hypothetical protein
LLNIWASPDAESALFLSAKFVVTVKCAVALMSSSTNGYVSARGDTLNNPVAVGSVSPLKVVTISTVVAELAKVTWDTADVLVLVGKEVAT